MIVAVNPQASDHDETLFVLNNASIASEIKVIKNEEKAERAEVFFKLFI